MGIATGGGVGMELGDASPATKKLGGEGTSPGSHHAHPTYFDNPIYFQNRCSPKIKWPKSSEFSDFGSRLATLLTD